MGLSKVKINSNIVNKSKKWLPMMTYTLGKIEKCYSVKVFMSYTVHWANEYFIISFVLNHLCILFSLSPALSLSLFSLTDRNLSLFSISPVTISLLLLLLSLTDHYRTYASKPLPANPSHPCQQTFTSNPPYPMSTKHQNHGREKKKKKKKIRLESYVS